MSILKWLKKYFIPHEHNEYKPHSLRTESAIVVLILVLLIEVVFFADPFQLKKTNFFASILQTTLVDETNISRTSNDLNTLKENSLLDAAAKMKAEDMAANGYFAHTSPSGIEPWFWIHKAGYNYSYAGENLAINFTDSEDVIKAWLNSPAHRANMLSQHFTEIGIGIAHGTYQGKETTFVVQVFGKPAELQTVAVAANSPSVPKATKDISLENEITTSTVIASTSKEAVLGETSVASSNTIPASQSSWSAITSPKKISASIYLILMAIISIALLLNAVIKIKTQHLRLVMNGMFLIMVLNVILILNHYFSLMNAAIF